MYFFVFIYILCLLFCYDIIIIIHLACVLCGEIKLMSDLSSNPQIHHVINEAIYQVNFAEISTIILRGVCYAIIYLHIWFIHGCTTTVGQFSLHRCVSVFMKKIKKLKCQKKKKEGRKVFTKWVSLCQIFLLKLVLIFCC